MSAHLSTERLSLYLDAALEPPARRRLEAHLGACPRCRHRLAGLERVVAGLRQLPAAVPPPDLAARIGREIKLRGRRRPFFELRLPQPLGGSPPLHIFALVLALGAIVYLFAQGVDRRRERPTRIVLPAAPNELAAPEERAAVTGALTGAPRPDGRRLLGGVFHRIDGVWVEVGLARQEPDERIVLRHPPPPADPELAALPLPLRFAVGGRIVQVELERAAG